MIKTKEIKSIANFMDWVQENIPSVTEQPPALFYRGHADESFQLLPSVYRLDSSGKSYRVSEYLLYQDMLHRNPVAFSEDKTVFERLVRMQHYGLPTRLFDVTQNPLVALFFACEGLSNTKGEVMFWKKEQSDVYYPVLIPQPALAGLEKPVDFNWIRLIIIDRLTNFFSSKTELSDLSNKHLETVNKMYDFDFIKIIGSVQGIENDLNTYLPEYVKCKSDKYASVFYKSVSDDYYNDFRNCKKNIIVSICDEIHATSIDHDLGGLLRAFVDFCFVYPPLNNERIRRQQGAFIVCPPIKSGLYDLDYSKPIKVTIEANAKGKLLKDLENMGITRSYLFPELDEQAKDIKRRYPATASE